jgi:hypothetical protein
MILKATQTMDGKRWNTTNLGFGKTYQDTDFGKEVGMDEIHWWIFKKEPDVDELGARTEEALTAGQTLQIAAVKLKRQDFEPLISGRTCRIPVMACDSFSLTRRSQPNAMTLQVSGYPEGKRAMDAILFEADDISVKPFEGREVANLSFAQACWEETLPH